MNEYLIDGSYSNWNDRDITVTHLDTHFPSVTTDSVTIDCSSTLSPYIDISPFCVNSSESTNTSFSLTKEQIDALVKQFIGNKENGLSEEALLEWDSLINGE